MNHNCKVGRHVTIDVRHDGIMVSGFDRDGELVSSFFYSPQTISYCAYFIARGSHVGYTERTLVRAWRDYQKKKNGGKNFIS